MRRAAFDEGSGQPAFKELQHNRLVQFGGRTFPAVWTNEYPDGGHATIPMENGNLVTVEHRPFTKSREGQYMAVEHRSGKYADIAHRPDSVAELHSLLDHLSTKPIDPEDQAANRQQIQQHLVWNQSEGLP